MVKKSCMIHNFCSLFASRSVQILVEISGRLQASRMEISGFCAALWTLLLAGILAVFVQMLHIMKSMHKEIKEMKSMGPDEDPPTTMQTNMQLYYISGCGERIHWRKIAQV